MNSRWFTGLLVKAAVAFGKKEHGLIVHFQYGLHDLGPLKELESRLEVAVETSQVGDLDGDEVAVDLSSGALYLYGPDVDRLYEVVEPILENYSFMRGARVTKVYGSLGSNCRRVELRVAP